MGTCSSTGYSQTFSLSDLQNLDVNTTREMGHGCGPNVGGTAGGSGYDFLTKRGFGFPNNGEFQWGGLGSSCSMCSGDYGCDNCTGTKAVSGRRGTVKRTAYLADPATCCTTQPGGSLLDNKTCSPDYAASNYGNGKCNDPMASMCAQGTNIVSNANCVTWRNAVGPSNGQAQALMKSYCSKGDNLTNGTCQQWLSANKNELQGWYDTEVGGYCASHPDNKTFCACYNLPEELKNNSKLSAIAVKPYCYYDTCSSGTGAYVSKDMKESTCPVLQVCDQKVSANLTDSEIMNLSLVCNQTSATPALQSASNTTSTTNGATTTTTKTQNNSLLNGSSYSSYSNLATTQNLQVVAGSSFAILLIIGAALYFTSSSSSSTSSDTKK